MFISELILKKTAFGVIILAAQKRWVAMGDSATFAHGEVRAYLSLRVPCSGCTRAAEHRYLPSQLSRPRFWQESWRCLWASVVLFSVWWELWSTVFRIVNFKKSWSTSFGWSCPTDKPLPPPLHPAIVRKADHLGILGCVDRNRFWRNFLKTIHNRKPNSPLIYSCPWYALKIVLVW